MRPSSRAEDLGDALKKLCAAGRLSVIHRSSFALGHPLWLISTFRFAFHVQTELRYCFFSCGAVLVARVVAIFSDAASIGDNKTSMVAAVSPGSATAVAERQYQR